MLGAMRFVGAKNAIAEPKQLSSAAEVCPGAPTPAVAVLPVTATSPSGAKIRQVGGLSNLCSTYFVMLSHAQQGIQQAGVIRV